MAISPKNKTQLSIIPHWATGNQIPCCVPYWDSSRFFKTGGLFAEPYGYHVTTEHYLEDFDEWLPNKWKWRGDPPKPTLLPDMLPMTSWENNLRKQLQTDEWDRLRKFCYQAAGHTCKSCGSRGEPHVEAHEVWRFEEATGVQKLTNLLCLCPICHKAKHLGFAQRIGVLDQVYARLQWLNDWSVSELEAAVDKAQKQQEILSQREWKIDTSFLLRYGVR